MCNLYVYILVMHYFKYIVYTHMSSFYRYLNLHYYQFIYLITKTLHRRMYCEHSPIAAEVTVLLENSLHTSACYIHFVNKGITTKLI